MFKIKNKKKALLYEKYKQQLLLEETNNQLDLKDEKVIIAKEEVRKSEKRTEEKGRSKKIKNKISIDASLVISVCSLENGVGSSHISKSLAYFIKNNLKKSVCIVDIKDENKAEEVNGIEIYKKENLYNLFDQYKYIILDVGKYEVSDKREIKLSQIKIMCSILDENYLKNLADFIKDEDYADKWKYIFNHVPKNQQKKVAELMEDYEYWCMPVNDAMIFDKKMKDVLYRLVIGGTL